jgi:hypothetical protein
MGAQYLGKGVVVMSKREKLTMILPKLLFLGVIVVLVLGGLGLFIGSSTSNAPLLGFGSIHCRSITCSVLHSDDFFVFEGDTIEITYDVIIDSCREYDENGRDCDLFSSPDIYLVGGPFLSSEVVWDVKVRSGEANAVTITAPQSGFYSISVYLRDVEGEARVEWSVQRGVFKNLDPAAIGVGCGLVLSLVLVALGVLICKMKGTMGVAA